MQQSKTDVKNADSLKKSESLDYIINSPRIKLLHGFSVSDRSDFFTFGYIQDYYLHDMIISENQDDMNVYILIEGEVSIWKSNVPVLRLKEGNTFNEARIFFPKPVPLVVRSEGQTKIFKISRDKLLDYFVTRPERLFKIFTLNVLTVLQHKIEYYEQQLVQSYQQFK